MGKTIVLFGAGASHGSEPTARTPPLGAGLFDELAAFAPSTWGVLPSPWPSSFRADFEPAMASFIGSGGFGGPLQWDMAEYFLTQFSATPQSAYVALLKALAQRIDRYEFVTLNYEMMLFQARALAGVRVRDLNTCLPHGNAYLCCVGISATHGVSYSGGLSTGGRVRVFTDMRDFYREKAANVFPPVMSYFEPNKFTVSCANCIESERTRFAGLVADAHAIAVVGARVHTVDKHIWEPLARTPAAITYVSGARGAADFAKWASGEGRSGDNPVSKYFREGIPDLVACLS
jgi:hypothetical protein